MDQIVTQLREALLQTALDPDEAVKPAGKLQFLTETLAGDAMKACLLPLYKHGDRHPPNANMSIARMDSIKTIVFIV